jgi:hypothetical protein
MKALYTSLFILFGFTMVAQSGEDMNLFDQTFQGMFNYEEPWYIPEGTPPAPPVPLDGGLIALLLAGGAAGYRQYTKRKG